MKKVSMIMCMVCLISAGVMGEVLFSDSFDRDNSTDIDASSVGMAGSLAPLVYQEAFEGSGQASSVQVMNNQLNIAVGAGMSSLYLDRNFTDGVILSEGGFSVSLDVTAITNADDAGNRFGGFGVGLTATEAAEAGDAYDAPAKALRPALHLTGNSAADFYADLALDNKLRVWNNGVLLNTIDVGAAVGTIKTDFLFADFNAGSSVTAKVYFNGALQDTQTFTWDNTDANYIGISGRTAAAGVFMDNLEIATVPEPATLVLLGLGGLVLRRKK